MSYENDKALAEAVRQAAAELNRASDAAMEAGLEVEIVIAQQDQLRPRVKRGDVAVQVYRSV